jgi:hypothetical protein
LKKQKSNCLAGGTSGRHASKLECFRGLAEAVHVITVDRFGGQQMLEMLGAIEADQVLRNRRR